MNPDVTGNFDDTVFDNTHESTKNTRSNEIQLMIKDVQGCLMNKYYWWTIEFIQLYSTLMNSDFIGDEYNF